MVSQLGELVCEVLMARGSSAATGAATTAQNNSNTFMGNANGLFSTLAPELQTEVSHPSGIAQPDLAAMNTASQQSAGGSMAGAVGQGALAKSRLKNAGAGDAAIADSSRGAGEDLSKRALQTQIENAGMKAKQQQAGLSGLEGLTGMETGAANQALGIVPQAVNANTNAANQSWDWAKMLLDPAMAAAGQSQFT